MLSLVSWISSNRLFLW